MDPLLNLSPEGELKTLECCGQEARKQTMEETLALRRAHLQSQVNDIDAALEALKANPQIVTVLELIRKVNRY